MMLVLSCRALCRFFRPPRLVNTHCLLLRSFSTSSAEDFSSDRPGAPPVFPESIAKQHARKEREAAQLYRNGKLFFVFDDGIQMLMVFGCFCVGVTALGFTTQSAWWRWATEHGSISMVGGKIPQNGSNLKLSNLTSDGSEGTGSVSQDSISKGNESGRMAREVGRLDVALRDNLVQSQGPGRETGTLTNSAQSEDSAADSASPGPEESAEQLDFVIHSTASFSGAISNRGLGSSEEMRQRALEFQEAQARERQEFLLNATTSDDDSDMDLDIGWNYLLTRKFADSGGVQWKDVYGRFGRVEGVKG